MKNLLTHLDKGCRNAHPFLRFSKKNFYSVKRPPHLFGIAKPNDTLFHRKNEKIFFIRLWALYFACPENAFSLIPTENSKMHTLNRKKFLPLHLFGIERSKRTLFSRKMAKNFFEKTVCLKNIPSLVPTGRGHLGTSISKSKKQAGTQQQSR